MVIDMATKRPVRRRDLPPTHILPLTPNAYHERRRAKLRKMSGWLRADWQRKRRPQWKLISYKAILHEGTK
jgi:hypothetical protein